MFGIAIHGGAGTLPHGTQKCFAHRLWSIVEGRPAGMRKHIAEFAALVNRPRRFGRAVASNATRKGKLFEEFVHPGRVPALFGIDL